MDLATVTLDLFRPHTGSEFRLVLSAGETLGMTLGQVEDLTTRGPGWVPPTRRAPFSLTFQGPLKPLLPQRIYRFEHAVLEPMEIFVTPIGPEGGVMRYEAVFN